VSFSSSPIPHVADLYTIILQAAAATKMNNRRTHWCSRYWYQVIIIYFMTLHGTPEEFKRRLLQEISSGNFFRSLLQETSSREFSI
jgi:hypothetical protein